LCGLKTVQLNKVRDLNTAAALLSQTLRHGVICVLPVVVKYLSLDTISPHMVVGLFLWRSGCLELPVQQTVWTAVNC